MNFAKNFQSLRKKMGLSQEDIAEKLHISRQAVSKWENGQSTPDIDTCLKLCEVLKISPNQLLLGLEVEDESAHQSPKNQPKVNFLIVSIFLMLVFVCGTIILVCNLYNGIIFEPIIHNLAIIMIGGSLVAFFVVHLCCRRKRKPH